MDYASIDRAPEERARGITINTACVEYQTQYVSDTGFASELAENDTTRTSTVPVTPTMRVALRTRLR